MAARSSLFDRLFRRSDPKDGLNPLYAAVVAAGREPHWYLAGSVPDTVDGRFDMIVAVLAQALLRLEQLGAAQESVWLTELFVDDMDGQLRESGVGDLVVGKRMGRLMSVMGGRIDAVRAGLAATADAELAAAIGRNATLNEGADPALLAAELRRFATGLGAVPAERLLAGELPQ